MLSSSKVVPHNILTWTCDKGWIVRSHHSHYSNSNNWQTPREFTHTRAPYTVLRNVGRKAQDRRHRSGEKALRMDNIMILTRLSNWTVRLGVQAGAERVKEGATYVQVVRYRREGEL